MRVEGLGPAALVLQPYDWGAVVESLGTLSFWLSRWRGFRLSRASAVTPGSMKP